jgi:hypothetical protein
MAVKQFVSKNEQSNLNVLCIFYNKGASCVFPNKGMI